jgi:hypothetical protein
LAFFFFPPVYAKRPEELLKGGRPFFMSFSVNTFWGSVKFRPKRVDRRAGMSYLAGRLNK